MTLINLINRTNNAKTAAVKEANAENLMFSGILINHMYSKGIPAMEKPVQMNWKSPSEIDSTNILEAQIKPKPVDVVNLTDNMTEDGLIQKFMEPTLEPALVNVLEEQAKLEQTHISNKNLTPIIHKVTNGTLATNETLQKNLKPILYNALGNISKGKMVLIHTGALG
ncbi:uncharacterized protein LOC118203477 [Stegodyphus dumicola]|uniref:uncharacterized protein LOC118203477 n=1 Tax=Stegodyphus dumicola TaxID=202533 RepID=UPI0015AD01C0|nr:uncharacterized protein LOC118203477 [Stegodyphus dumicola]XP_035231645.1 uncharacterized protein LOC118203477 [Stegodyphus dumicola]XP_035231647.1 uncharacterized protein LOC118203477 [Stegodyphus dumicola]